MSDPAAELAALRAGGKAALARALSAIEAAPEAAAPLLDAALAAGGGLALGLTGPPGVGKSTLAGALLPALRRAGRRVAVLAVDPSSRLSGGALLGDRTRIRTDPADAGAFVRSMAAGDRLGGLAAAAFPALVLLRALFDIVLVETVGVGQNEAEVAELADLTLLCLEPGAGDGVQFMKAGLVERPDLVAVTKGDRGEAARRTAADAAAGLALGAGRAVPVTIVSAATGEGLPELLRAIDGAAAGLGPERREAQMRSWAVQQIRADFGRFGVEILRDALDSPHPRPFARLAALSRRLRDRLQEPPLTF